MPKHYKEMVDEIINKMDEDAPTNAVAHGGVDMNPNGRRVKKKTDVGTTADAENKIRELIMKKFGKNVKENTDNNNVVLRGINETLNKLEDKIDEKSGIKKEEEFYDDIKRFKYLKRLFRKYEVTKEIKIRLVLNHLVVLQNVFGAEVAITLLLYKVDNKYWSILKTCLNYLEYLYPHELNDIQTDKNIEEMLKELWVEQLI